MIKQKKAKLHLQNAFIKKSNESAFHQDQSLRRKEPKEYEEDALELMGAERRNAEKALNGMEEQKSDRSEVEEQLSSTYQEEPAQAIDSPKKNSGRIRINEQ